MNMVANSDNSDNNDNNDNNQKTDAEKIRLAHVSKIPRAQYSKLPISKSGYLESQGFGNFESPK